MISNRTETIFLLVGDMLILYLALFLTLIIRYGSSLFDLERMFRLHLLPFSILFALWVLVFFIVGLYEKHTLFLQKQLPQLLSQALVANVILAIVFFYFIPAFKITPKINLFLYLFVSSVLFFLWRRYRLYSIRNGEREKAVLIGSGDEMKKILYEINHNPRYRITFAFSVDADSLPTLRFEGVISRIRTEGVTLAVVDLHHKEVQSLLPHLYNLLFSGIQFADMHRVYEDVFDRIPLSLVRYRWFLENSSLVRGRVAYDTEKRLLDCLLSFLLGMLSIALYPFVYAAIKIDDGGALFVFQDRVGLDNRVIHAIKFRTMSHDDKGLPELKEGNRITRVGAFLRKTRIDELPQLWNVLRGDMSLIGPRPELPSLVSVYEREVPYYRIRHLIKPGLSGWAQLYHRTPPKVDANASETATKLSYDLYYLKNRSLELDVKIALKTLKVLLSRSGV